MKKKKKKKKKGNTNTNKNCKNICIDQPKKKNK